MNNRKVLSTNERALLKPFTDGRSILKPLEVINAIEHAKKNQWTVICQLLRTSHASTWLGAPVGNSKVNFLEWAASVDRLDTKYASKPAALADISRLKAGLEVILTFANEVKTLCDIPNRVAVSEELITKNSVCNMDSAENLTDKVVLLESYALTTNVFGTGRGTIKRSPDAESYRLSSTVTLSAHAEDGSIFNGWHGDAIGLIETCNIAMTSAMYVTAEFIKLNVGNLENDVQFNCVVDANMSDNEAACIFYLTITNKCVKEIHVQMPFASYVTSLGEEIDQSAWLKDMINGGRSSSIRAGAFKKIGLVFSKSRLTKINLGDHLHVTVFQTSPARRLSFCFRCTDKKLRSFTLIKAVSEVSQSLDENGDAPLEIIELLQRMTILEENMQDIFRRLEVQQSALATVTRVTHPTPSQTLPEVLAWLCTQASVPMAVLRLKLLPLDLMPSAVIDDINERAYDLAGEAALDQSGDAVAVQREVLLQVLAAWGA